MTTETLDKPIKSAGYFTDGVAAVDPAVAAAMKHELEREREHRGDGQHERRDERKHVGRQRELPKLEHPVERLPPGGEPTAEDAEDRRGRAPSAAPVFRPDLAVSSVPVPTRLWVAGMLVAGPWAGRTRNEEGLCHRFETRHRVMPVSRPA